MAGSGYRDWVAGDVPTASQFDTFLQEQVVGVYDDATDRDTQLSVVKAAGMVAYLVDVKLFTAYDGAAWVPIAPFFKFASAAARNTALADVLAEGLFAYLVDTNTLTMYTGAAWSTIGPTHGAPISWTPVVTQSGNVTVTNIASTYTRLGRMIFANFILAVTGTGTAANVITVTLPVDAVFNTNRNLPVGAGIVTDASQSPDHFFMGQWELHSDTTIRLRHGHSAGTAEDLAGLGTFNLGLATSDQIEGTITYVAAADA